MPTNLGSAFNPQYTQDMQFKPVPPGTYPAKLVFQDPDESTRWEKKSGTNRETGEKFEYYTARITATISEGDTAGRKVFGTVNTIVNNYGGTKCHDIIQAVGNSALEAELFEISTHEELVELVSRALASEPVVSIRVDWEAPLLREADGTKDYNSMRRGASKWPIDEKGERSHIDRVEEGTYVAQATIKSIRA